MDTSTIPSSQQQLESPADIRKIETDPARAEVLRWNRELQNAERVFESYHKRVDTILERYRDERGTDDPSRRNAERRYNALWSMKETLKPLLFASHPIPYVTRTHDDDDPQGRDASLVLQRILFVKSEAPSFYDAMSETVDEYLLAGRGTTWVTYMPEFAIRESEVKTYVESEEEIPEDPFEDEAEGRKPRYKAERDDDGKTYYREKLEAKVNETCVTESVNSKDILHGPATKWRHVPWVARRVPMLRTEAIKRFGKDIGEKLPLSAKEAADPRMKAPNTDDFKGQFARAVVWEIWDRVNKQIVWICPDYPDRVLDKKKDLLKLENFFPCPKPLYATMTNDTLVPIPDYAEWQDIAMELDDVTHRIHLLTSSLRVAGVYAEETGDIIKRLVDRSRQNEMIPVKNFAMFAEKGGLEGQISWFPLDKIIQTLDKLYEARGRLVQELYEITGISDIVRGASDPRETASAQKLKGSFANARLTTRQKSVARHACEVLTIIAEITCSLYSDETIMSLSNATALFRTNEGEFDYARWKAALALLRDEPMRVLRIKIETESLAEEALSANREEASEFLQGVTSFLTTSSQILQQAPNMGPVLGKMLLFATRKFKVGRALEADIESALRKLEKTGLGTPQDQQQQGGDQGMNAMEHDIESQKLAMQKREIDLREREVGLKERQAALDEKTSFSEVQIGERKQSVDEFKAQQDVRLRDKQIDTQAQSAHAQTQLKQVDMHMSHQREQQQMQADREDAQADMQMRAAEHQAGRQDAAMAQQQSEREFHAGRQDAVASRQDAARSEQMQLKDRAEDRKMKMAATKAKAVKQTKPSAKKKTEPVV